MIDQSWKRFGGAGGRDINYNIILYIIKLIKYYKQEGGKKELLGSL